MQQKIVHISKWEDMNLQRRWYWFADYRLKPEIIKPRVGKIYQNLDDIGSDYFQQSFEGIELTNDVKKALEEAGIDYEA